MCKTINEKAREDIRKHKLDEIREKKIETSKSLETTVTRTHNRGKNRMITLLNKQRKHIKDHDKIMARIE